MTKMRANCTSLKEVTPKPYCCLLASKHAAFSLAKVLASEVLAILKKSVSKDATLEAAILKLSWQPRHGYLTSFHPT